MRILAVFFLGLCMGCGDQETDMFPSTHPAGQISIGSFSVALGEDHSISIHQGDRVLLRWQGVDIETFTPQVSMLFGLFRLEKAGPSLSPLHFVFDLGSVGLASGDTEAGTIALELTDAGNLRVSLRLDEAVEAQAIRLTFFCSPYDHFWGFGEQFNYVDFRGHTVPIWAQEQGVGRAQDCIGRDTLRKRVRARNHPGNKRCTVDACAQGCHRNCGGQIALHR